MRRFLLGHAQMFMAVVAVVLLLTTGVNRWSIGAAVIAGALTLLSIVCFRLRPN